MGHQGPCSLPGPRVIAVEDADVEQILENDVKRRNEIAYDFVGDVVRATGFPCFNLPFTIDLLNCLMECLLSFFIVVALMQWLQSNAIELCRY